jgi:hypothetical protein
MVAETIGGTIITPTASKAAVGASTVAAASVSTPDVITPTTTAKRPPTARAAKIGRFAATVATSCPAMAVSIVKPACIARYPTTHPIVVVANNP